MASRIIASENTKVIRTVNSPSEESWLNSSVGRAPAAEAWGPGFVPWFGHNFKVMNLSSTRNKKKKKKIIIAKTSSLCKCLRERQVNKLRDNQSLVV
jgi:hypothetical protein